MSGVPLSKGSAARSSTATESVTDTFGRPLRKLRISVTDRCNLRCSYCMPRDEYPWLPRAELLNFAEIERFVRLVAQLGVRHLRLTGGEPLLRTSLHELIARLTPVPGIRSVSLTTNGMLLRKNVRPLMAAGLAGITVSLDTLRAERFEALTRRDGLAEVLTGIDVALEAGFERMKINTVVMRGVNDDEILDLAEAARVRGIQPRFIEYMDVGGATDWRPEFVVPRPEILAQLASRFGSMRQLENQDGAPADRFEFANDFVVGVISSTSLPFCRSCDRARFTADGQLFKCLYARAGLDVRALLRGDASDADITARLTREWRNRDDRGAEQRLAQPVRGPWVPAAALLRDPHLEMHNRGG